MQTQTASSLLQVHEMRRGSAYASGLIGSSINTIRSVARAVLRWHRQRRDILELQRMDDRLLADIGITRGEAEHMVCNGRWGQAAFDPDAAFPVADRKLSSVLEFGGRA